MVGDVAGVSAELAAGSVADGCGSVAAAGVAAEPAQADAATSKSAETSILQTNQPRIRLMTLDRVLIWREIMGSATRPCRLGVFRPRLGNWGQASRNLRALRLANEHQAGVIETPAKAPVNSR